MSYAPYFRIKAELCGMLLAKSENDFDRAWYAGLVRSYTLLAASEDRHYNTGLKILPTLAAHADEHADYRKRGKASKAA